MLSVHCCPTYEETLTPRTTPRTPVTGACVAEIALHMSHPPAASAHQPRYIRHSLPIPTISHNPALSHPTPELCAVGSWNRAREGAPRGGEAASHGARQGAAHSHRFMPPDGLIAWPAVDNGAWRRLANWRLAVKRQDPCGAGHVWTYG